MKFFLDETLKNRFGAYFLTLLCPWTIQFHCPSFELSYSGLMQFIGAMDLVHNTVDCGRFQYLQNCVACMGGVVNRPNSVFATSKFLKRSATTYSEFLEHQSKGLQADRRNSDCSDGDYESDGDVMYDSKQKYDHNIVAPSNSSNQKKIEDCQVIIDMLLQRFQEETDKGPRKQKILQDFDSNQ